MPNGILSTYGDFLPLTEKTPRISLGEGGTPLVQSERLAKSLGLSNLFFKLEGCNPTGSFKDRGMVMAVANAIENHSRQLICASTGNTSASAAAYGARCGIPTVVLVPKGNVAVGKIAQAIAYGAKILSINGNFDKALELAQLLAKDLEMTLVNSINPYRIEGQKTAAFEICETLRSAPNYLCIPVGNAGNITAYWRGFKEWKNAKFISSTPKMFGFQAEGAAPIVRGEIVKDPQTIASAIRIGNPASWAAALEASNQSNGLIDSVSDEEILSAYKDLARMEGIFCEPASAASVAGMIKALKHGLIDRDGLIVCILTGTGLKDPDLANQIIDRPLQEIEANTEALSIALQNI
jgi:threonine synthase